jgi:hypothetical protein
LEEALVNFIIRKLGSGFFALALLSLALPATAGAQTITSISPTSGPIGMPVTIAGSGFGATQGTSSVSLNGTLATTTSWSDSTIVAIVPSGASSGMFSVTVNGQTAYSSSFTITSLPSGWTDTDIGSVGTAGSASYANGTFTVKGAGTQIWGSADSFNFLYQPLSGDGTIIARVVTDGSNLAAGVMIRETLNLGSTNAIAGYYTPTTSYYMNVRTSTGGSTSTVGSATASLPYWVKVVRSGSTFSGYASLDRVNWTQIGSSQTICQ